MIDDGYMVFKQKEHALTSLRLVSRHRIFLSFSGDFAKVVGGFKCTHYYWIGK